MHHKRHQLPSYAISIYCMIKAFSGRVERDALFAYAGQAAYFIVISALPFLILLSATIRLIFRQDISTIVLEFEEMLPKPFFQWLEDLAVEEIPKIQNNRILSISGITLLWSTSRGTRVLAKGIRRIYQTPQRLGAIRNYLLSFLLSLYLLAGVLAFLAVMILGRYVIIEILGVSASARKLFGGIRFLVLIAFLSLFFTFLFRVLSDKKIRITQHLPGALFSSLCFTLFTWGFSLYVSLSKNSEFVYGRLSTVVMFLIWLYFCVAILLCGAELNMVLIPKKDM